MYRRTRPLREVLDEVDKICVTYGLLDSSGCDLYEGMSCNPKG